MPDKSIDKSLKKLIAQRFFELSFEEIQNHPGLKHLNLTEEEILKNRYEIKQVIQSHQKCGESKTLCNSLEEHFKLERNKDNDLILCTYKCNKKKDCREIKECDINKKIEETLKKSKIFFNLDEVRRLINYLKKEENKTPEIIQNQNIGNPEYSLKNIFSTYKVNTQERNKHIIYLFHATLTNLDSLAIKSEELRQLALDHNWSRDEDSKLFHELKKVSLLIILDFGMESNTGKNYYYLDFITDLLQHRHQQHKTTCIFTPLDWKIIKEDIVKNNYYVKNSFINEYIQKIKLEELNGTIKNVFSHSYD